MICPSRLSGNAALTADERAELEQMTQSRAASARSAIFHAFTSSCLTLLHDAFGRRRCRIGLAFRSDWILIRNPTIFQQMEGNRRHIETPASSDAESCWKRRHPGQKPSVITPALQAKVLQLSRRKPNDGSTHWSRRKMANSSRQIRQRHRMYSGCWLPKVDSASPVRTSPVAALHGQR